MGQRSDMASRVVARANVPALLQLCRTRRCRCRRGARLLEQRHNRSLVRRFFWHVRAPGACLPCVRRYGHRRKLPFLEETWYAIYLIVIDDIWSIQVWDIIKCAFVDANNRSRVITTTRIEQVATECCSYCHDHIYKMKPLNDLDSRRLFFQRIFGSDDACPEQYKDVSQKILKKCGGVPLVILSIASLLASQECMHKEKWENIQKSLVSELETNPTLGWMRHVLNLSYNDLPHPLKTCLLYLGIYPEDYKIEKVDLLRRWLAEGFVSHKHGLSPEEVAESYFNELINRNMIKPAVFEYCELTCCQLHDVMLDFIVSKSIEENFITIMDERRSTQGAFEVRRLCLQFKNANLVPVGMSLSQIRSFTIFGYSGYMPPLSRFELLRVLDLHMNDSDGTDCLDLSAICKLFQLRYLRANSNQLKLPKQIGELKHLETLDIRDATVPSIPSDVPHLRLLRHLTVPIDAQLPDGIGKLKALRTLGFFNLAENSVDNIQDLGELTNLTELDLIWTKHVVKAQGPIEKLKLSFLIDSMGKLTNLRSFHASSIDTKLVSPTCDFLSSWFPPPHNLQRLSLSFCTISKVPEWISQLVMLTSLKIKVKELLRDAVKLLAELPSLVYLDLSATKDPKEDLIFHSNAFPSLKEFGFAYTFSSVAFEPRTMLKLQVLHLSFSMGKQEQQGCSLTGIEHLLNLEQLTARIYSHGAIGLTFRDAILRHPRSHTFNVLFPRC